MEHAKAFDIKTFGVGFLISFSVYLFYPISTFLLRSQNDEVPLNADSVITDNLWIPIVVSLVTALWVSALYAFIVKANRIHTIIAVLLMTFLLVKYEERLLGILPTLRAFNPIPNQSYSVYSLVLITIFLVFSYYVAKVITHFVKKSKTLQEGLPTIVLVMSLFLLLTTLLPFARYVYSTHKQLSYKPPLLKTGTLSTKKGSPNIYYILLDRYTNNDVLKADFDYDNTAFTNNLKDKGFTVNESAYANYPYTALSVASTMRTDYLADIKSEFGGSKNQNFSPLFRSIQYSPTVESLKKVGYQYQLIGNWFGSSDRSALASEFYFNGSDLRVNGQRKYLGLFDSAFINNSYTYEFLKDADLYKTANETEQAQYQVEMLKQLTKTNAPDSGKLMFAHILVPHNPFVFNADGSIASYDSGENNNGKPVKEKYLDQVKYINSEIKKITDDLIANDPNAVIVLQSDEGIYPYGILQDEPYKGDKSRSSPNMNEWSDRYLRAKFGILAAYRLPGVNQEDIDKYANSVNIFKLVLNQYFGANLQYDPVCHIGLTDRSKYYSFTDLTKRLTGTENPACATK
ncbi:MAG: hypothetical protein U0491_02000 [Candidatus Saccharimonadales bacterium]